MKLNDLFIKENDEVKMDLSMRSKNNPIDDISGTSRPENLRSPVITLRHINKLKRMKYAQRREEEQRQVLLSLMYATPTEEEGESL